MLLILGRARRSCGVQYCCFLDQVNKSRCSDEGSVVRIHVTSESSEKKFHKIVKSGEQFFWSQNVRPNPQTPLVVQFGGGVGESTKASVGKVGPRNFAGSWKTKNCQKNLVDNFPVKFLGRYSNFADTSVTRKCPFSYWGSLFIGGSRA